VGEFLVARQRGRQTTGVQHPTEPRTQGLKPHGGVAYWNPFGITEKLHRSAFTPETSRACQCEADGKADAIGMPSPSPTKCKRYSYFRR